MNKGTVLGVYSKDWSNMTLWSFKLEGDMTFWRCGRTQPDIKKGQYIEFDADKDNNVDIDSIEVKEEPDSPKSDAQRPTAQSVSGSAAGAQSAGEVANRIKYQAARADAARIVSVAMQTDHLPMASNTAKGKKLDLVVGYIEQVTKQLIEQEENNS